MLRCASWKETNLTDQAVYQALGLQALAEILRSAMVLVDTADD